MFNGTLGKLSVQVSVEEPGSEFTYALSPLEGAILALADGPQPLRAVAAAVADLADLTDVESTVDSLERRGVLLRRGISVLTLAPFSRPTTSEELAEWCATLGLARGGVGGDRFPIVS